MKQRLSDITRLILVLIASLAVSCADDDGKGEPEPPMPEEPSFRLEMAAETRSEGDEEDAQDITSVHVYVTTGTTAGEYTEGDFFKMTSGWSSTASVKPDVNYCIYGYAPADIGNGGIDFLTGETNYENGAILTLTAMNPVSASDVGVVVGVRQENSLASAIALGSPDITMGSFDYVGQEDGENFVCLKLAHLYAAIEIKAQVGVEYDELRSIKIRKMELRSDYAKPTAVVTLTKGTGVSNIEWTGFTSGGSTVSATIFESDEEDDTKPDPIVLTPTTAQKISSGYLVGGQKLKLVTTYDILDKVTPTPNVIRSNCTAVNQLDFSSLVYGQKKTVTLHVAPTYLYQLSETDSDSPTIVITP